jgi:hypothetical protein
LEVDDEAHPRIQVHGRNRRETHQITKSKIRPKIPPKISKMKNIELNKGDDSTQKDNYIDANQEFTMWKSPNHSPSLWKIGEISHFSPLFSKT